MGRLAGLFMTVVVAGGVAWFALDDSAAWWPVTSADAPDRVVVIPRGAAVAKRNGAAIWTVPVRLDVRLGQSVVVRNEDDEAHPFLGVALAPGQTARRTFSTPGRFYFNPAEVAGVDCELEDASEVMAVVVARSR